MVGLVPLYLERIESGEEISKLVEVYGDSVREEFIHGGAHCVDSFPLRPLEYVSHSEIFRRVLQNLKGGRSSKLAECAHGSTEAP